MRGSHLGVGEVFQELDMGRLLDIYVKVTNGQLNMQLWYCGGVAGESRCT